MKLEEVEYTDRYGDRRTRRERILAFPNFWDYDYYYFNAIEEAETQGKHMAVLKCRQRGYSRQTPLFLYNMSHRPRKIGRRTRPPILPRDESPCPCI